MNTHRVNVIQLVQLIADVSAQSEYKKNVPIADAPAELVCMWFDDTVILDSPEFKAAFQRGEWNVLLEFNKYFDARVEGLPGTLEELHGSQGWKETVDKASWVLDQLDWRDIDAKYDEKTI